MPTSVYVVPSNNMKVRYREPYLSQAINQKFQTVIPVGVYEGFRPVPGATALRLTLSPGDTGHAALIQSDTDATAQLSVHLTGSLDLNLTAYASKTVAVAITASYSFPSETASSIKVYDLSSETVPTTACVLARVTVPAAGVIPTANISLTGRTYPWDQRETSNAVPFLALTKNGNFEFGSSSTVNVAPPYWRSSSTDPVYGYRLSASVGPSGTGQYMEFVGASPAAPAYFYQRYGAPIVTGGTVRLSLAVYHVIAVPVGQPYPEAQVLIKNPLTGAVLQTLTLTLNSATTGAWVNYTKTFIVPGLGTTGGTLDTVQVYVPTNFSSAGSVALRFTDIVVEAEQVGQSTDIVGGIGGDQRLNSLTLSDANNSANKGVVLEHFAASDTLFLSAVPGVVGTPNLLVPGTVTAFGAVYADGGLTRYNAGTLNIGNSASVTRLDIATASSTGGLYLSRTGQMTTVSGDLTIAGTAYTGALNVFGDFSVNTNRFTVNATTGNTTVLGDFAVNTNKLTVAAATGNTAVAGTLTSAGDFTVGVSKLTVAAATGNTAIAGTATVTGVLNANGGIGRSVLGALNIGNSANVNAINIGTASSTGGVTISQTGQTTTVNGALSVVETATFGVNGLLTPSVDRATAGSLAIGASTATGISLGTNGANTVINIGTTAPSTTRSTTIGANSAGTTVTTQGESLFFGASASTSINVGSASAASAVITVGNAPTGGTTTLTLQGNTVNLGSDADTSAVNIGYASAPTTTRTVSINANSASTTTALYGATITAGNTATTIVSVGATTASTATVTLGNAPTAGAVTTLVQGNTLSIGTDTDVSSLSIGHAGIATSINGVTGVLLSGATPRLDTSGSTALNIGTTTATTVNISRATQTTAVAGALTVGTTATVTTSLQVPTIDSAAGLSIGTGGSTSLTLGRTGVATTIEGLTTSIGTAALSGAVNISRVGQMTTVNGNLTATAGAVYLDTIDNNVIGPMYIGGISASTLYLGRSSQEQRLKGNLVAESSVYLENGTGGAIYQNRIGAPAFGNFGNSDSFYATTTDIVAAGTYLPADYATGRGFTGVPAGTNKLTTAPLGYYVVTVSGYYKITSIVSGAPASLTIGVTDGGSPASMLFSGLGVAAKFYRPITGTGAFVVGDAIPFSFTGTATVLAYAATGGCALYANTDAGTVRGYLDYQVTVHRIGYAA